MAYDEFMADRFRQVLQENNVYFEEMIIWCVSDSPLAS